MKCPCDVLIETDDKYVNLLIEFMPGIVWYTCLQLKGKLETPDRWSSPLTVRSPGDRFADVFST